MQEILKRHHISFKNAFAGIWWAFGVHPNFRVHGLFALAALGLSAYFRITHIEFIVVVFTIVLVFVAEMINTSIESMTDLITKEWRQEAKIAKDVSAGMTLVVAFGALVVGLVLFIPYIQLLF